MEGREYRYQKDISMGGVMYHVRCDDWREFIEAVNNIAVLVKEEIPVAVSTPSTVPPSPVYPTINVNAGICKTCGAPTLPEKRIVGKDGRAWWVQDCSTGDKTHKGPIRPAS